MHPVILTIAGSDPSGGAGIQADLLTIAATGGYGTSAVAAITVQNSRGLLSAMPVPVDLVREQIEAIFEDMTVAAVKTGMLLESEVILAASDTVRAQGPAHLVVDPVMAATCGGPTMEEAGVEAILNNLLPLATLLTPNVPELERLSGSKVRTVDEAAAAGRRMLDLGAQAVLVKGGHLPEAPATDILVTPGNTAVFRGDWQDQPNSHGTGCVLSAAISTYLGLGDDLETAVDRGRSFLSGALQHGRAPGAGPGSVNPLFRFRDQLEGDLE